jgi:hypothetical protein
MIKIEAEDGTNVDLEASKLQRAEDMAGSSVPEILLRACQRLTFTQKGPEKGGRGMSRYGGR